MILDILLKEIHSKPDTIQFAKDRKYEEAWIIHRDNAVLDEKLIKEYLASDFQTLIVEFIWNSEITEKQFVLTIFYDEKFCLPGKFEFILNSLILFSNYTTFEKFIEDFDREIIGHKYLLQHPVEAVKMSIFNYWVSSSPVDLWDKNEKFDFSLVETRLAQRPDMVSTELNFQGLLFMFNKDSDHLGPYYGLKTPCCHKVDNKWTVDLKLIEKWMNKLI